MSRNKLSRCKNLSRIVSAYPFFVWTKKRQKSTENETVMRNYELQMFGLSGIWTSENDLNDDFLQFRVYILQLPVRTIINFVWFMFGQIVPLGRPGTLSTCLYSEGPRWETLPECFRNFMHTHTRADIDTMTSHEILQIHKINGKIWFRYQLMIGLKVSANLGFSIGIRPKPK